jgi:hypothetical protein
VVVIGILPIVLAAGAIYGLVRVLGGVSFDVSLSPAVWIPLSLVAAAGTLWGLGLGLRVHGRAGPLKVGVFGLVVAALGFVFLPQLVLAGVVIVLAAAAWSAVASAVRLEVTTPGAPPE